MKAIGCHVFAGGFSMGVRKVFDVPLQLEVHGLGQDTVESMGIEFVCRPSSGGIKEAMVDWPEPPRDTVFMFGNPRCTGFSCTTAGYDEGAHGAWSKPTRDIHEFMHYGTKYDIPVICWESVQQAWTVGRDLLHYLAERYCRERGYRVAHLFINAATFGNAQHRKRYFFLAYKADMNFNIVPPDMVPKHASVGDVICGPEWEQYEPRAVRFRKDTPYDADCYQHRAEYERAMVPHLTPGYDMNVWARKNEDKLKAIHPKLHQMWDERTSDMPFSMHGIARLHPDKFMPVISGSAARFVHPTKDRFVTIRELARLMGWPADVTPKGPNPVGQIGKGICPEVGVWLAEQVKLYFDGHWGEEDWQSSYDHHAGMWAGEDFAGRDVPPLEKVFDLTRYCPPKPGVVHEPTRDS